MQTLLGILILPLGDLLETITPIIFLILYGIFQLVAGQAEAKKNAPKPKQPRAPQPAGGPAQAAGQANAPPNQADALRREVEDFLRRAQGQPPLEEPATRAPLAEASQPPLAGNG